MSNQVNIYNQFVRNYSIALIPLSLFGIFLAKDQFNIFYTSYLILWGILVKNYWFNFKLPSLANVNHQVRKINDKKSYFKNITIIPIILVVLLIGQLFTLFLEVVLTQIIEVDSFVTKTAISLVPTILTTVLVKIITFIFDKTIDPKINYIITIWTSFTPLLLTLFIYLPFGYKLNFDGHLLNIKNKVENSYFYKDNMNIITNDFKINQLRFMDQYKYFIITNQLVALALENILPKILNKDLKYIEPLDLSLGYLRYIMNFGFVVVFSNIWSISPIISLLFTLINLYIDQYKIKKGKVTNNYNNEFNVLVKTMYQIMNLFTVLSSLVQPALIVMYRYSSIPDVGLTLNNSDNWFKSSPVNFDYSLVIAIAFSIEHLCFGLDKIIKKLCITKLFKESNTKPTEVEQDVDKNEQKNDTAKSTSFEPKQTETKTVVETVPAAEKDTPKPIPDVAKDPKITEPTAEVASKIKSIKTIKHENIIPGDILADVTGEDSDLSNGATLPDLLPISKSSIKEKELVTEKPAKIPSTVESQSPSLIKTDASHKHPVLNNYVPETSPSLAADAALKQPIQGVVKEIKDISKTLGDKHEVQKGKNVITTAVKRVEPSKSLKKRISSESVVSKLKDKKKKKKIFGLKI